MQGYEGNANQLGSLGRAVSLRHQGNRDMQDTISKRWASEMDHTFFFRPGLSSGEAFRVRFDVANRPERTLTPPQAHM